MSIQRYEFICSYEGIPHTERIESGIGSYVLYSDHHADKEAALAAQAERVKGLEAKVEQWKAIALFLRNQVDCDDLTHKPSQYHKSGEPCPVEQWLDGAIEKATA